VTTSDLTATASDATLPVRESSRTGARTATRVYYFDYLRTWATIGVVLLHSSSAIYSATSRHHVDYFSRFTFAAITDSLGRFGVGCFFMVSGALLLAAEHRFRLGRQLARVGLPLLVWSAVYLAANAALDHAGRPTVAGSNQEPQHLASALQAIFIGPVAYHLWFVYVLVGIYLAVPLLRPVAALPDPIRKRLLEYALALWFVFTLAIPAAYNIAPGHMHLYSGVFPTAPVGYLGTFVLGFYLHRYGIRFRGRPLPAWVVTGAALTGFALTALGVVLEQVLRSGSDWAFDNLTPQVTLFAASVFLLARDRFDRRGRHYPFIALFSRLSYRVYLVHALVLHYLRAVSPLHGWYQHRPEVSIVTMTVVALVIAFVIAWLIDRISVIRNYV
jgi:surface polysaccharide O-acyltransferase-like enzyme